MIQLASFLCLEIGMALHGIEAREWEFQIVSFSLLICLPFVKAYCSWLCEFGCEWD